MGCKSVKEKGIATAAMAAVIVVVLVVAGVGAYFLMKPRPEGGEGAPQAEAVTLNTPASTTENSTTLSWSQSTDEDFASYAIYRSTSSGVLGDQIATITDATTTSLTVTDLSPNTTYYFTVRVNRTGGIYEDSTQVSTKTSQAGEGGYETIENGRFGGGGGESMDFAAMQDLGAHWRRIPWDVTRQVAISSTTDFNQWDAQVAQGQQHGVTMYGILNPKAESEVWPTAQEFAGFLKKVAERYDNDGENDMPGLIYPILVYEICNEIEIMDPSNPMYSDPMNPWKGFTNEMYLDYLQKCHEALGEASPDAQLACGAIVGGENPTFGLTFENTIGSGGANYFDILSYHSYQEYLAVDELISYLGQKGIGPSSANPKPIWLTESQFTGMLGPHEDITQEEAARRMVRSYVYAFAKGFTKVSPSELTEMPYWDSNSGLAWSALVDRNGDKRPSYYAYQTLIAKLDYFTEVEELAQYQYKFTVDNRPVYVLWGTGTVPSEITGTVTVTNISGNEQQMNASEITLSNNPIYVEIVS
ncbi:MAG: fibronectin type III domain-containing protein [Candidatus Hadarchaeota archaeon]